MAKAFIYLELTEPGTQPPYEKPVVNWVKATFPEITILDIDSGSDRLLYDYTGKLLTENAGSIVYVNSTGQAPLQQATVLIEHLIRLSGKVLVLLQGQHVVLEKLFASRPGIRFFQASSEADLKPEIAGFFKAEQA